MDDTDDVSEVDQSDLDEATEFDHYLDFDPLLEGLVLGINKTSGTEIGVTLTTSGGVITGTLVGVRAWYLAAAEWSKGSGIEGIYTENTPAEDEDVTSPPVHVHLKDARFLHGGAVFPAPPATGAFWRGRLTEVAGWSIGQILPDTEA